MKIENTPEAKARFFALYYLQKVYRISTWLPKERSFAVTPHILSTRTPGEYLELAPLSQISDEDAIEVGRILGYKIAWEAYHIGKDVCLSYTTAFTERAEIVIEVTNFLRSRGYYVGDGTEVEYGWCRMKGEKP